MVKKGECGAMINPEFERIGGSGARKSALAPSASKIIWKMS